MAEETLVQFCLKAGKAIGTLNLWRIAYEQDQFKSDKAAKSFVEQLNDWTAEIAAVERYENEEEEWKIGCGVWKYGDKVGEPPLAPIWPACIPEYFDAMATVLWLKDLKHYALHWIEYEGVPVRSGLQSIIGCLDRLSEIIEHQDTPGHSRIVSRTDLAQMLNLQPKTLANRASELPDPIARDTRNVPLYRYDEVRERLIEMYPEKEFLLPAESD